MTFLRIYLVLCLVVVVLYHFSKYAKRIPEKYKGRPLTRFTLFYVFRPIFLFLFWPVILIGLSIQEGRWKYYHWIRRRFTYYDQDSGVGIVTCQKCGYSEEIISFVHHLQNDGAKTGYQCQGCGKFYAILHHGDESYEVHRCDCGGKLSREKPMFCKECGRRNVIYRMRIIT